MRKVFIAGVVIAGVVGAVAHGNYSDYRDHSRHSRYSDEAVRRQERMDVIQQKLNRERAEADSYQASLQMEYKEAVSSLANDAEIGAYVPKDAAITRPSDLPPLAKNVEQRIYDSYSRELEADKKQLQEIDTAIDKINKAILMQ